MAGKLKEMQSDDYEKEEDGEDEDEGEVRRITIEPAENGFIVDCEYKSKPNECCSQGEKKVATDLKQVYTILVEKFS